MKLQNSLVRPNGRKQVDSTVEYFSVVQNFFQQLFYTIKIIGVCVCGCILERVGAIRLSCILVRPTEYVSNG